MDEQLLRDYCKKFFGYGDPTGKYWFIGLEEAGGRSERSVADRLRFWDQTFKRKPIVDCFRFHDELSKSDDTLIHLFKRPLKRQQTWDRLVRVQLAAESKSEITREDVSLARERNWGRKFGDNCLLELFPLPARRMKHWPYDRWTTGAEFKSKPSYRKAFLECRMAGLRKLIEMHSPEVVVFYGGSPDTWSPIVGFDWRRVPKSGGQLFAARFHKHRRTLFALIYHPAARSTPDDYFLKVGLELRYRLQKAK